MSYSSEARPGKIVLLIIVITSYTSAFMGSSINVALPAIGKEYAVSAVVLGWVTTAFFLTNAAFLIPVGKLSDMYGRIKFFKWGIIIFTLGSLLCALSTSGIMLISFRGLQGIGTSMIFTTSTAILVSTYSLKERGRVIGINVAAVYIGLSSGPFFGGIITESFGWRYIFYLNFLAGIIVIMLTYIKFNWEWKDEALHRFDYKGSVIFIIAMTLVMLGSSFLPGLNGVILLALGLALSAIFYYYEKNHSYPVFDFKLFFSNKAFTYSNLAALINYSATAGISFLMSLYLQNARLLTPQDAGLILVAQPFMMAVFSPLTGKLSDRIEPRYVATAGMIIITAGLLIFTFLSVEFSWYLIVINLLMLGTGFALFSSPNMNAIMSSVEKQHYGVASSTLASMRMIGQMMSMGIIIIIFSVIIGNAQITPANTDSFLVSTRAAFGIFSALCILGIFASMKRGSIRK